MPLDRPSIQPFPIHKGRYDVRPGMRAFGRAALGMEAEEGHFRLDRTTPSYLRQKLSLRRAYPGSALQVADGADEEALVEVVWGTLEALADEEPAWAAWTQQAVDFPALGLRYTRSGSGLVIRSIGGGRLAELGAHIAEHCGRAEGAARWLEALACVVPCDLAVMASSVQGDAQADRCEALHVCFPSSWAPRLKVGRDFAQIHEPVANNEAILKGHANLVRAMCFMGPFVRYAWGLHRHAGLDSHPDHHPERVDMSAWSPDEVAAKTWLRVERQTTKPFPDWGRGLFTIRTYIEPLIEVASDPSKAAAIASAIRSMNEASLRYKGMLDRRDALLAYLEG